MTDTLDELLSDPMIQLVMARDRVRPEDVRLLLERVHGREMQEPQVPLPHVIDQGCWAQRMCA